MPSLSSQSPVVDPQGGQPEENRSRNWVISLFVVIAFLLFFTFVTVLAVKWVHVRVPSSVLEVVNIPPEFDDCSLQIEGYLLAEPLEYRITPKLRGENNRIRIYLDSGVYRLSIVRDGVPLFSEPFNVLSRAGIRFDLKRLKVDEPAAVTPAA